MRLAGEPVRRHFGEGRSRSCSLYHRTQQLLQNLLASSPVHRAPAARG